MLPISYIKINFGGERDIEIILIVLRPTLMFGSEINGRRVFYSSLRLLFFTTLGANARKISEAHARICSVVLTAAFIITSFTIGKNIDTLKRWFISMNFSG